MQSIKYACMILEDKEDELRVIANDNNCPHACERKKIDIASECWFDGWVEEDPNNCKNKVFNLKSLMDSI